MRFAAARAAIADIAAGKMIVVVDAEDRENEGDLTMAADCATPQALGFMMRFAKGLVCVPMAGARLDALSIPLMQRRGVGSDGTAFTVSVDAAHGIATGVSAADRAATIRTLVDPASRCEDIVCPGHTFPLRAQPDGVLTRAGHTEAAVDLARLAGFSPAGVVCEILDDAGAPMTRAQLASFAARFSLLIVTIECLIEYRLSEGRSNSQVDVTPSRRRYGCSRITERTVPESA